LSKRGWVEGGESPRFDKRGYEEGAGGWMGKLDDRNIEHSTFNIERPRKIKEKVKIKMREHFPSAFIRVHPR
jgi:hypothetical protein